MMKTAPIVLFAYNRPNHTASTMNSLARNSLATESDLTIYLDGPRTEDDEKLQRQIEQSISSHVSSFKSIKVIHRPKNLGLRQNILDGLNDIFRTSGRAIVLEDDLRLSEVFLEFMNIALDKYEDDETVWHISGWNYPLANNSDECFFWKTMNCWGWGTWKSRWQHYRREPKTALQSLSFLERIEFDLNGVGGFNKQLKQNQSGTIDTWAVFWYLTIYRNKGLCLNPVQSLVENLGLDGSGENCPKQQNTFGQPISNKVPHFPEEACANAKISSEVCRFLIGRERLASRLFFLIKVFVLGCIRKFIGR